MGTEDNLKQLPLDDLHKAANARFGGFAGWSMPITYPLGVMKEHLHTREKAGLFDISHMQLFDVAGPQSAALLSRACPLELQYYDDDAVSALAIQSGRADAEFNPNAPQAYRAAIDHKIKLVGTVNAGWPLIADVAITTRKGSGIADSLTAAINELIADGKYAQSLERWKLSPEALDKSRTNPPGLPKI